MSIPHGLPVKAYRPAVLLIIAVIADLVIWHYAGFGAAFAIAIVLMFLVFCFWLAYGSPNGGHWPHRE